MTDAGWETSRRFAFKPMSPGTAGRKIGGSAETNVESRMTEAHPLPERSCRTCTLCCRLPDIDALAKPANAWCTHCTAGKGCGIYSQRPALCRDFLCLWMTRPDLGPEWDPLTAHMMIYEQGPQTTVLVDPDHPSVWRQAPYGKQLGQWAAVAELSGGYVIVFEGDDVFKVEPAARITC